MTDWAHVACPNYCHECPALGGELLPHCMGTAVHNDLLYCTCAVEAECVRELAKRLAEEKKIPAKLRDDLRAFASSKVPGRSGRAAC